MCLPLPSKVSQFGKQQQPEAGWNSYTTLQESSPPAMMLSGLGARSRQIQAAAAISGILAERLDHEPAIVAGVIEGREDLFQSDLPGTRDAAVVLTAMDMLQVLPHRTNGVARVLLFDMAVKGVVKDAYLG